MKTTHHQERLVLALILSSVLGAGSGASIAETLPAAADPSASVPRPIPPSKSELVDSAFKKLAQGKDYVAKEDAMVLDNFAPIFESADTNHDGKLSFAEFRKAWTAYTQNEKINRG